MCTHSRTPTQIWRWALAYLQGNIPGHVDVTLVLVHPDLGYPQSVAPHVGRQVLRVGFVGALDVCDPGARQHLHAAATLPDLPVKGGGDTNDQCIDLEVLKGRRRRPKNRSGDFKILFKLQTR